MSWPHMLSFSRVLAGPVVAALVLARPGNAYLVAFAVFTVFGLTDLLDGKLARVSQRVSPLGVFLDTTSDKVLVSLVLVGMSIAGLAPAWVTLCIIGREFLISGLRSFAASSNRIMSAHIWGKGKAAITMVAIGCVLLAANGRADGGLAHLWTHDIWDSLYLASQWLLGLSAALTVVSGARYVVDAWPLLRAETAAGEVAAPERPIVMTKTDRAG